MGELTNPKVFERKGPPVREFLPDAPTGDGVIVLRRNGPRMDGHAAQVEGVPRRYIVHSPTGFEWGYGGSGPSDLALNILGMFVDAPEAYRLHQKFKWDRIATMPEEGGTIPLRDVRDWLIWQWAVETHDAGLMAREAAEREALAEIGEEV